MKLFVPPPVEVHPDDLLRIEGLNQGDSLSMVIYGLSLSVLVEQIQGGYNIFLQSRKLQAPISNLPFPTLRY